MEPERFTVPRWFDRHLHVRDGDMLRTVLPSTLNSRATGAVIIGNLEYPHETSTIAKALAYRQRIKDAMPAGCDFQPRMTLYLTDSITPEEVVLGFREGVWCAAKLMMTDPQGKGGTTGSQQAVRDLRGRYPVFAAMEKVGMPLLGHWEAPEADVDEFDREIVSVERDLMPLLQSFPGLRVVVEHITDGRAADFVASSPFNIRATVTAHHLMLNRNALFEGGINPLNYCKPVLKSEAHRRRIRYYVITGNPRFGAGTDSAPHDEATKARSEGGKAGIFSAPKAVEKYATYFEEYKALQHLGPFLSEHFLDWYGMEVSTETMTLERTPCIVPEKVGPVRVFKGGATLPWTLVG